MRSRAETLDALLFVLIEKIYPTKPILMRNDSEAASIVVQYVSIMLHEYYFATETGRYDSQIQIDAMFVQRIINPLEGLRKETVRKYIADLWRDGAIDGCIRFEDVKGK